MLATVLAGAGELGCHVAWAVADRRRRFLRVVADALGAEPANATRNGLLDRVESLCATAPLVLVVEDLHLADDASVLLWHQLAAASRLLPLLLVASCLPDKGRGAFANLRRGLLTRDGEVNELEPPRAVSVPRLKSARRVGPGNVGGTFGQSTHRCPPSNRCTWAALPR